MQAVDTNCRGVEKTAYLVEWDDGDALCELASLQQGLGCLVTVNHNLAGEMARKEKGTQIRGQRRSQLD